MLIIFISLRSPIRINAFFTPDNSADASSTTSSHPRITAPPVLPPAAAELSPLRNDFSGEPLHCGTAVYCRTGKDIPIRTIVHFAWHSTYYHHIHDMLQFPGKCLIHTCRKNPGQAADHLVDLFCRHVKAFERR